MKFIRFIFEHLVPLIVSVLLYSIGIFIIIGGVTVGKYRGIFWSIFGVLIIIMVLIWQIQRTISHLASDNEIRFGDIIKEYEETRF